MPEPYRVIHSLPRVEPDDGTRALVIMHDGPLPQRVIDAEREADDEALIAEITDGLGPFWGFTPHERERFAYAVLPIIREREQAAYERGMRGKTFLGPFDEATGADDPGFPFERYP